MMMRFLIRIVSWLQTSFLLRIFGVRSERRNAFLESRFFLVQSVKEPVTWFHASSLGELEMLRPLMDDFHARGQKFGVSAFSDSALKGLQVLKPIAVYADLSPREDEWIRLFHRFNVKKLILAKYDFWPGMLNAARKTHSPVIVINAQMRKSLSRSLTLFKFLSSSFPRLYLFANDQASAGELSMNLKDRANVFRSVDPRWERIARRKAAAQNPGSVELWAKRIQSLPKPLGIVGSAWREDLSVVLPALVGRTDSFVVVPHDLSLENVEAIRELIAEFGLTHRALIVDEMGLLVELYRFANWAFVGGGFGKGIHSLLEPASYAIPVACGPNKYDEFRETKELTEVGILTRCESSKDVARWLNESLTVDLNDSIILTKREAYRALLEECLRIQ
jgi:3-deoxy-D-manno-octulosonic-acid transferase